MRKQDFQVGPSAMEGLNTFLTNPDNPLLADLRRVVAKYGSVEEINARAREAGRIETLLKRLERINSPYIKDLEWLMTAREEGRFIPISAYRARVSPERPVWEYDAARPVTLEISALQYFPWVVAEARQCIERGEVLPGRFIRVRKMKEQEADEGDLPAVRAAMKILGASCVETLDTKGTDGSNVHLGGPETLTGYFGGIGQPNGHPLQWVDEALYYYVNYGVDEVLNINPGTVFLGYLLYRLGVSIRFKISVFMGNDNPYAVLWTLLAARMFARDDGSTPLSGFNLSTPSTTTTWPVPPPCGRNWGSRIRSASSTTLRRRGRASSGSPMTGGPASSSWQRPFPTSLPNTREETPRTKRTWPIPRTSSTTSATGRKSSHPARWTPCWGTTC